MSKVKALLLESDLPHLAEFRTLLEIARKESDRGIVLIHASMMDELLKRSIEAFLIQHKDVERLTTGFNSPIGTFSARILTCFALGIISEDEYQELILIKKIRNDFAHVMTMSFDNAAVVSRCKRLKFSIQDAEFNARSQFITSAAALTLWLVNRPHYVSLERLIARDWKY